MMVRTGKALAQERAWREAKQERVQTRVQVAAPPLRDDATFWLCVCVLIAFVAALFLH